VNPGMYAKLVGDEYDTTFNPQGIQKAGMQYQSMGGCFRKGISLWGVL